MIVLNKTATQNVFLTLTEKQLLTNPNYLFVFTGRSDNREIKFIKLNAADTSLFRQRYNKFSFIVDALFPSALIGQYTYNIYEQASATNTDITGLNLIETGIMELKQAQEIFTQADSVNTFTLHD